MTHQQVVHIIKECLLKYPIDRIGIFGSYARGEARPDSDIDILIRYHQPIGLFDIVTMTQSLSEQLQRKVDLVTEPSLYPSFRAEVERDLQIIYEA